MALQMGDMLAGHGGRNRHLLGCANEASSLGDLAKNSHADERVHQQLCMLARGIKAKCSCAGNRKIEKDKAVQYRQFTLIENG